MKPPVIPVRAMLLLGPTGSGKTPLGAYIEQHGINGRRCCHFDFGHELRRIGKSISPPERFTAGEHTFIKEVLLRGALLENEHFPIAAKVIGSFMDRDSFGDDAILLLNGLPRHVDQAKDMEKFAEVGSLVLLECTAEDVIRRIRDNTGNDRTARADDTDEMIQKKLGIFKERTEPLIRHYSGNGAAVFRIRVTPASTAGQIYTELASLYAASSQA